ncbi:helix-turn-helix transcriptional regulator [Chitinophaga agrisoli]|uniref:Helix-turn-helix transcriptional regulator n=2 Tax=Chitinophaga agrisoli TaxID=2607653 RepID=A0A5B2VRW4_9BACT|nr:helix-turn-helix transcriptional regulator [Chitinophaga agrisoli]
MDMPSKDLGGIIYSNYKKENRSGEEFIQEHSLGYIISGLLTIVDGDRKEVFGAGDLVMLRKNNLAKFFKHPAQSDQFTAITLILDKDTLEQLNKGQHFAGGTITPQSAVLRITPDKLLKSYFESLLPYFMEPVSDQLVQAKKQEGVLLLLRNNPTLAQILFDFGVPGKIDLEAFMNRNFRYNITIDKLAYLTGRSLATFKRDFEKTFNSPPSRWIQQQRLKEAHYLISEKKNKPSDVYLEVGFESLSHFSYAFKQYFGYNASTLERNGG